MITFSELGKWGRLGNQMYEYAALRGIGAELGYEVKIPPPHQHALGSCFDLSAPVYTKRELRKVRRVFHEPRIGYSPRYREIVDGTDLRGYFQSPRYFPSREVVLREFAFHDELVRAADSVLAPLRDEGRVVVGVTLRRGDYQLNPAQFHPLWDTDFYEQAFALLDHLEPVYLVSSDEPEWCRDRFVGPRFRIVDGIDDRAQLAMLTRCDHNIVANSSFAWWSAWLNEGSGMRIAASRWWGDECEAPDADRDPLPDGWTEIAV